MKYLFISHHFNFHKVVDAPTIEDAKRWIAQTKFNMTADKYTDGCCDHLFDISVPIDDLTKEAPVINDQSKTLAHIEHYGHFEVSAFYTHWDAACMVAEHECYDLHEDGGESLIHDQDDLTERFNQGGYIVIGVEKNKREVTK